MTRWAVGCVAFALIGCGGTNRDEGVSQGASAGGSGAAETDATGSGSASGSILLDVGATGGVETAGGGSCVVEGDIDGVGDCEDVAPPDSFDPEVQWEFSPADGEIFSVVIPLVANLTDDDGNGSVDLCDVPDVVLVATSRLVQPQAPGHIYLLNGLTGELQIRIEADVKPTTTPAIADLDSDGVPEIITAYDGEGGGRLIALAPDGELKWESLPFPHRYHGSATAVADVDNDGRAEILYEDMLFDDEGTMLWDADVQQVIAEAPTIADLDGDGPMEIIFGNVAVRSDGSPYYSTALGVGFPQVANLDDDPQPEVLVTTALGISMLEHDGQIKYSNLAPTGVDTAGLNWLRPATIHNFDADPQPEFAMSSRDFYSVYEADGSLVWSAPVLDESGFAAGTAFDFLGDGEAEAMYADESTMFVFNGAGEAILTTPRASHTLHEYPVVADIDNDGSAEIVFISEERMPTGPDGTFVIPTIQAIRDKDDRWIQARRIWNQHTYHVTNVREDATVPQFETPHWQELNTFRTNAQLNASGEVCQPVPEG